MNHPTRLLLYATLTLAPLCAPAQSQQEMNAEARQSFATADRALNQAYQKLTAKLDAEALAKLKAAQRAWLTFRDAQAALQADLDARGGSMHPMIYSGTQAELTKARTAELQRLLKEYAGADR